jgi:hypothetical protein
MFRKDERLFDRNRSTWLRAGGKRALGGGAFTVGASGD